MGASDSSRQLDSPPLGQLYDDLLPMARRARNRAESNDRRFVNRRQARSQPFVERWQLIIHGRVQGVGFRGTCSRRALDLGLRGWVRNCRDGSVEVQAEGNEHRLTELRIWCECGPPGARVDSIHGSRVATTGADWFEIRPDHFQGHALTR